MAGLGKSLATLRRRKERWPPHWLEGAGTKSKVSKGLLAAVSRMAAILPNDLAPTNMNGPLRTFTASLCCCSAARHCGHSCIVQHFVG
jgi:hypothetical protein